MNENKPYCYSKLPNKKDKVCELCGFKYECYYKHQRSIGRFDEWD